MFTKLTDPAKGFVYFAIAFVLTIIVSLMAPLLGNATMILHMYSPTVAVLLMLLVVTRDGYARDGWLGLGLNRAGLRSWPVAIVMPFAVVALVYVCVWLLGIGSPALPEGWTLADVPGEFAVGLLISCVFALGEEIGFRGYLLPRLLPLGTTRALLLSGFLHGIWHFPLILIAGALPIAGSWLIAGPIFLALMTAAGVIYGYLRLTSGSVYPPTLAHGVINTSLDFFKRFTVTTTPIALTYLAGETGLIMLAVTTLAAAWCLYQLRRPSARPALRKASA